MNGNWNSPIRASLDGSHDDDLMTPPTILLKKALAQAKQLLSVSTFSCDEDIFLRNAIFAIRKLAWSVTSKRVCLGVCLKAWIVASAALDWLGLCMEMLTGCWLRHTFSWHRLTWN